MDLRKSENITVYLFTTVSVAAMVYLRPTVMIPAYFFVHILFIALVPVFQLQPTDNAGKFLNSTVIMVLSVCINIGHYHNRVQDYKNQMLIQQMNEQLRNLAITDSLSGLYNRRYLDTTLREWWEACRKNNVPLSVTMLDIDDFKAYNDQYGHDMGDHCIEQVAEVMVAAVEKAGGVCCRYGGEEFIILLSGVSAGEAMQISGGICKTLYARNLPHQKARLSRVTISAGVCCDVPTEELPPEEYLKHADRALYAAKRAGKNRACLDGGESDQI
jgi:diguanylate cyclase (GGDEF)-like protein